MKSNKEKLHLAFYEVNRIANNLFVSYGLLSKLIETIPEPDRNDPASLKKMLQHVNNELADYSIDLTDAIKFVKEH